MKYRYQVSEAFKQECKANFATRRQGKVHIVEDNIDITGENYEGNLIDFTVEDDCYVSNKFIGTTVARKITVNILNPHNEINLENKEIQAFAGINDEVVPFGNFIIEKPENEEVEEKTTFIGYDYMIKFNAEYNDNNIYPISLKNYLTNLCNQVGLELGSKTLINEDYMIQGNPFTNNQNCRTVLSAIAELCGGFAKIGRDNKVYIINISSVEYVKGLTVNEVHHMKVADVNNALVKNLYKTKGLPISDVIDGNTYMKFSKNNQYGEVNSLSLSLSQVKGENNKRQDADNIAKNGLTEIDIADNPFLINSEERQKVIDNLWDALKGLRYVPFKITEYYGFPYLDTGDKIEILDTDDTKYISFIFKHVFTYNGSFKGELETKALTKTQSTYQNTNDVRAKFKNVELAVDKINGEISSVIEKQDEQNNKINRITQDIDGTTSEVSSIKNNLENNYDTSEEVSTKIEQKADKIREEASNTYATQEELVQEKSERVQTATEINQAVSKKVGNDEIISKINQSAENVTINADKIDINGKAVKFKTNISETIGPFTEADRDKIINYILGTGTLTSEEFEKYDINDDGVINSAESIYVARAIANGGYYTFSGTYEIDPYSKNKSITLYDSKGYFQAIISLIYNYFRSLYVDILETSLDDNKISSQIASSIISMTQRDNSNGVYIQIGDWYNNKSTSGISITHGGTSSIASINIIAQQDNSFIDFSANGKYTSISAEGVTTPEGKLQAKPKNLYNNTSGTTGTVTLSESASNFSFIEIFYKGSDGHINSVRVHSPNGKTAWLSNGYIGTDNISGNMKYKVVSISGTTITTNNYILQSFGSDYKVAENSIYILRVDGYR